VSICNLKSDDDGNLEIELFSSSNDTLRNDIASHDTAKDVDENSFDLSIGGDKSESFFDLVSGGSA
jgi:hypothetical protein